jgi:hypothetical protein
LAEIELSHEEMQRRHKDMAVESGDQPKRVKAEAKKEHMTSAENFHRGGCIMAEDIDERLSASASLLCACQISARIP